jgi:hypothetical protein
LTQSYVSSNPLSGLVLSKPLPLNLAPQKFPNLFFNNKTDGNELKEFDFEPFFPVAVITSGEGGEGEGEEFRLIRDLKGYEEEEEGFVRRIREGENGLETWEKIMDWMDENGL